MKTLYALLILLALPISPKAETVTLLEIDTTWYDSQVYPCHDVIFSPSSNPADWLCIDTISRTFILPDWLVALKPGYTIAQGSYRHNPPRVDTAHLVDTVWLCPRVDTTWYPGRIEWLSIPPTNPAASLRARKEK